MKGKSLKWVLMAEEKGKKIQKWCQKFQYDGVDYMDGFDRLILGQTQSGDLPSPPNIIPNV
jgi:hypothetical protein